MFKLFYFVIDFSLSKYLKKYMLGLFVILFLICIIHKSLHPGAAYIYITPKEFINSSEYRSAFVKIQLCHISSVLLVSLYSDSHILYFLFSHE